MEAEIGDANHVTPPKCGTRALDLSPGDLKQPRGARVGRGLRKNAARRGSKQRAGGKRSEQSFAAVHGAHCAPFA
jgi:hypothetical protein